MITTEALISILIAITGASAGLWWFQYVLKSVKSLPKTTRRGVYALVWLAYFILIIMLVGKTGGAG